MKLVVLLFLSTLSIIVLVARGYPFNTSYDDVRQNDVYNMRLPADTLFQLFKDMHERSYESSAEEEKRRQIFADNVMYINKHNIKYVSGESTFYLGINQFSDMTYEEFVLEYANLLSNELWTGNGTLFRPPEKYAPPSSVDWRKKGYVTPVKNQGHCKSCWSFGATGSIEGQHFRKTGKLVSLSEQQLVDCSKAYGNKGCSGGQIVKAFRYVIAQGGIEGDTDYRYNAHDKSPCLFKKSKVRATIRDFIMVDPGEKNLEKTTAYVGPVSVSILVNPNFKHYKGGVFYDQACATATGHHAVLVVGYGSSPSNYWLVKNSWGSRWGEAGYIRMAKNRNNVCGIATKPVYPVV